MRNGEPGARKHRLDLAARARSLVRGAGLGDVVLGSLLVFVAGTLVSVALLGTDRPTRAAATTQEIVPHTRVLRLVPVADTYVRADRPRTRFGHTRTLRVDSSPLARAYLRFRVPDGVGEVLSATLTLYPLTSSAAGFRVMPGPSRWWKEDGLTYARSRSAPRAWRLSGPLAADTAIGVDVTPIVQHRPGRLVELTVTGVNATQLAVASREHDSHAPVLVIRELRNSTS
jgi:hypothetical protein